MVLESTQLQLFKPHGELSNFICTGKRSEAGSGVLSVTSSGRSELCSVAAAAFLWVLRIHFRPCVSSLERGSFRFLFSSLCSFFILLSSSFVFILFKNQKSKIKKLQSVSR